MTTRPDVSHSGWTADAAQIGLLEHLPCVAMVLTSGTRRILYANAIARQAGAIAGQTCYESLAGRAAPCVHCQAAEAWRTQTTHQLQTVDREKVRDSRWVPLGPDVYVHYVSSVRSGVATPMKTEASADPVSGRRRRLTRREKQVLQLIAEGRSNREIAILLQLSINTVHTHRTSLMGKLAIHRQTDLVRYAIRHGLTTL